MTASHGLCGVGWQVDLCGLQIVMETMAFGNPMSPAWLPSQKVPFLHTDDPIKFAGTMDYRRGMPVPRVYPGPFLMACENQTSPDGLAAARAFKVREDKDAIDRIVTESSSKCRIHVTARSHSVA
jgi:hypothetical protein